MKPSILMVSCFAMEKPDAELIHFSSIANGLCRQGHAVSIFHLSLSGAPANRSLLLPRIRFSEHFITARTRNSMFIKGGLALPAWLGHVLKQKPDILYVRLGIVSALFVIATRLIFSNRIKIITEHNGWIGPEALDSGKPKILATIGREMQRWSSRLSHRVRAVSPGIKCYLISLGVKEEKIAVIGNGTDTHHFQPSPNPPAFDFGFVGNLARWQGLDWLLNSFAQVIEQFPDATLAIAGTGPEEECLRKQLSGLGIDKSVSMLGPIAYDKVPQMLGSYRICMAPFRPRGSSQDNKALSPLKIRDYAACGKPIISSRIAGLEEIEREGFGILVEPEDTQGLAQAMMKLLDDQGLYTTMGKQARAYAETHYSWDLIAAQISDLIKEMEPS